MATSIAVTNTVSDLIDAQKDNLCLQKKEGLTHTILMLALTDAAFMARAAAMSSYLGDKGSEALEKVGLRRAGFALKPTTGEAGLY